MFDRSPAHGLTGEEWSPWLETPGITVFSSGDTVVLRAGGPFPQPSKAIAPLPPGWTFPALSNRVIPWIDRFCGLDSDNRALDARPASPARVRGGLTRFEDPQRCRPVVRRRQCRPAVAGGPAAPWVFVESAAPTRRRDSRPPYADHDFAVGARRSHPFTKCCRSHHPPHPVRMLHEISEAAVRWDGGLAV